MKPKHLLILAFFVIATFLGISYKNWFSSSTQDFLIVGTNAEYPPFTYIEDGKIVGFDIDLIQEIARRLDREITFKDMPFDSLIPAALVGKIHVIAAGMTYTPRRAQKVLFSRPYLSEDPLIIVSLSGEKNLTSVESLFGKRVIVNEGYTADLFMSELEGFTLIRLNNPTDGFFALKSKRGDAFVTSQSTIDQYFEITNNTNDFKISVIPGVFDNYSLLISPKHPELLPKINQILEDMAADGYLEKLKQKRKLK